MTATKVLCPRCEYWEFTPRDVRGVDVPDWHLDQYPYPALSRVERIDICTPCGQDEAMRDFTGAAPVPPNEWPVRPAPGVKT